MRNTSRHTLGKVSLAIAVSAFEITVIAVLVAWTGLRAQTEFPTGQDVVPAYEGFLPNPDGTFDLVFGYFNRNWEEEFDVPVGPDNHLEPGAPDQGQPTHFYPRRSRFVFHVRVPKDFGPKELVWTITTHGKTEKAYGTLLADYAMNDIVIMNNNGGGGSAGGGYHIEDNQPPTLEVEGSKNRTAKVGQSIALVANSTDDGIPKRRVIALPGASSRIGTRCCPDSASGLRVSWHVYRGLAANVTFDPKQIEAWEDYRDGRNSPYSAGWEPPPLPEDGKWPVHVSFGQPGTYVLRCLSSDGALATSEDITFVVGP